MASRVIFEGQSGRASLGLSAMTLSRHSLTVRVKEDFGMSKWVDSCSRAISRTIFCVRVVAMRSLAVASALRFTPRAFDRAFATALGLAWRAAAAASDLCAFLRFPGAAAPRPRCKQPRPKTSVAGTAMPDSGHDRAQRGQNPVLTFAWAVKSANSTSLPCLILLQIVQMPAIQY